ncbi:MAG: hypothetical protein WKF84_16235 [Pyrinomonadaceae bacterium]
MIGVPRLFEKIFGRARQKALAAGKAKTAVFEWAMKIGKAWARLSLERQSCSAAVSVMQHRLADRLVFKVSRRNGRTRTALHFTAARRFPKI